MLYLYTYILSLTLFDVCSLTILQEFVYFYSIKLNSFACILKLLFFLLNVMYGHQKYLSTLIIGRWIYMNRAGFFFFSNSSFDLVTAMLSYVFLNKNSLHQRHTYSISPTTFSVIFFFFFFLRFPIHSYNGRIDRQGI
jgi:hypothetical protein